MLSIAEEEYQNTKEYILKGKKIPIFGLRPKYDSDIKQLK